MYRSFFRGVVGDRFQNLVDLVDSAEKNASNQIDALESQITTSKQTSKTLHDEEGGLSAQIATQFDSKIQPMEKKIIYLSDANYSSAINNVREV